METGKQVEQESRLIAHSNELDLNIIREIQKLVNRSKDRWDKIQVVSQIILNALGILIIPIVIVIVGGNISKNITDAQIESSSQLVQIQLDSSKQLAKIQLELSKQIAQDQLTKDYVTLLALAASKPDDKELICVLDSLRYIKDSGGNIPKPILEMISIIKGNTKSHRVLQSISRFFSEKDKTMLDSYFEGEN